MSGIMKCRLVRVFFFVLLFSVLGKDALAIQVPLQDIEAWVEDDGVYFKLYDPILREWKEGSIPHDDEDNIYDLTVNDGIVAYRRDNIYLASVFNRSVCYAIYDPVKGSWVIGEDTHDDDETIYNFLVNDGVVAYETYRYAGGIARHNNVHFSTYNWESWVRGEALYDGNENPSMLAMDGIVAFTVISPWGNHVYTTVYDPRSGGWLFDTKGFEDGTLLYGFKIVDASVMWKEVYGPGGERGYDPSTGWYDGPTKPLAFFKPVTSPSSKPFKAWLLDMSIGGTSWDWHVEGEYSSTARTGFHIFNKIGRYPITQTVSNSLGSDAITQTLDIFDSRVPTYIVDFDLGSHGTRVDGGELLQFVDGGESAIAPIVYPDHGRTFEGWDADFSNITTNLTVHAVYQEYTGSYYDVRFELGAQGTHSGGGYLEQQVAEGYDAINPTVSTQPGWILDHWDVAYTNVTFNKVVNAVYEPLHLWAHYPMSVDGADLTELNGELRLDNVIFTNDAVYLAGNYNFSGGAYGGGNDIRTPDLDPINFDDIFRVSVEFKVDELDADRSHPVIVGGRLYRWFNIYTHPDGSVSLGANTNHFDCYQSTAGVLSTGMWHSAAFEYNAGMQQVSLIVDGETLVTRDLNFPFSHGGYNHIVANDYSDANAFKGFLRNLKIESPTFYHLVEFDLGTNGTRTGGGGLMQQVVEGQAAMAPAVLPNEGWLFQGWDRDFSNVESNLTIRALYEPSIVHVALSGSHIPPFKDWVTAATNIQDAVDIDSVGGLVLVSNGTYFLTSEIVVDRNIRIQSVNGPAATIVDGGGSNRCFNLGTSSCTISGLTITNGYSAYDGGGVWASSTVPVLTNCTIIGNTAADDGGGVHKATIYDSLVAGNVASNRGGGCAWSEIVGASVENNNSGFQGGGLFSCKVANSMIYSNSSAGAGGGMMLGNAAWCEVAYNLSSAGGGGVNGSELHNSKVFENHSLSWGGGCNGGQLYTCKVYNNKADKQGGGVNGGTWVYNSCIYGNRSLAYGGGAHNSTLYSCAVYDNEARGNGGGAINCDLFSCTLTRNRANNGGGIWQNATSAKGDVFNCVVDRNSASVGADIGRAAGTVKVVEYSCSPDLVHGVDGNITNAPVLASFSHLSPDSPCIGAGDFSRVSGMDFDGQAWLNPPSMGCDEYHGAGSVTGALEVAIGGNTNVMVGLPLELTADIRGAVYLHAWDFGDGMAETNNPIPSHTWGVPGSYEVVLTVYSDTYPTGVSATQTIHALSLEEAAIHVSPAGSDTNDGSSWAAAKASIQAGVDAQQYEQGLVLVSNGTYAVTNEIIVSKTVTIQSLNGPGSTIVDGGGSNRCFNLGGQARIKGFTIQNGFSQANGGGVYCQNVDAEIENCIVQLNHSNGRGGGVFRGTVINSAVCKNRATGIGGGLNNSIASNCTITQNKSDHIAGGFAGGTAYNCIVWHNQGIQLYSADLFNSCCPEVLHGVDGNITNAPELTSSSHISSNSPCRGAGVFADASGTDIDGEAWLNPPSMGCDELGTGGALSGPISVAFEDGRRMVAIDYALPLAGSVRGAVSKHLWDFGDGETATNQLNLVHSWSSPGLYDVILTAFNASNPGGVSATQTITVVDASSVPVLHVSPTGNDTNNGLSWATAKATIQAGVDEQPLEGGFVRVAAGIYLITNTVIVEHGITVEGADGAANTVIDGGGIVRCFQLFDGGSLKGLSIRNGKAEGVKGGPRQNTVVEDCLIYDNVGDGLYGTTVYNCAITNNAGRGMNDCTAYNCLVANNVGGKAGGMEMSFNNGTTNWSGAAYNCVITNNTALFGGGVSGGAAFNCLIADNHATDVGGGANDTLTINCTIVGNTAANKGGGTYKSQLHAAVSDVNCIVYNNSAPQFPNIHTIATAMNCCAPDAYGGVSGWVQDDPEFINAATGDYRLQSNSPCINWGNNSYAINAVDLDGNPRIAENYVDMGCYEYQGVVGLGGDQNGNGYEDSWEREYFGGIVDEDDDADGDGQSNADEYITGLDPTNGASVFTVGIDSGGSGGRAPLVEGLEAFAEESEGLILSWQSVSGRVYNVLWTPTMQEPFQPLEIGIHHPQNSYTDTVHYAESSGYYRVVVMLESYDADGDGLPNEWETKYAVTDASAHGDDDGFSNIEEFIAGTDPTNGASFFTAAHSVADVTGTNCFVVEWISIPDRLYSVQWSSNLTSGFQILETGIEHPKNSYTDTVHSVEQSGYYKVDVELK